MGPATESGIGLVSRKVFDGSFGWSTTMVFTSRKESPEGVLGYTCVPSAFCPFEEKGSIFPGDGAGTGQRLDPFRQGGMGVLEPDHDGVGGEVR